MNVRTNAGFTLIEALIALLIIMIGLLGVAGMQALAIRNSAQAHIRTLAGLDVRSLAAAMRANRAYWTDPSAASNVSISNSGGTISITPPSLAGGTNCSAATCTPVQSAGHVVNQWAQLLKQLPSGSANITRIATMGTSASAYAVTVKWSERRMQSQGTSAATKKRLTTVVVKP